jgi:hypothetical protein
MAPFVSASQPKIRFWVKLIYPLLGMFFFIYLIFPLKFWNKDHNVNKPDDMNINIPPRARIMVINTISIVLLFMSMNEFNMYQIMNPIGVNSNTFSQQCRMERWCGIAFMLFLCVTYLFIHNFISCHFVIKHKRASPTTAPSDREKIDKDYVATVFILFPHSFELFISSIICVASILINIVFICCNPQYEINKTMPMPACVQNT